MASQPSASALPHGATKSVTSASKPTALPWALQPSSSPTNTSTNSPQPSALKATSPSPSHHRRCVSSLTRSLLRNPRQQASHRSTPIASVQQQYTPSTDATAAITPSYSAKVSTSLMERKS